MRPDPVAEWDRGGGKGNQEAKGLGLGAHRLQAECPGRHTP